MMNVFEGFSVPFEADTTVYSVYVTENKMQLSKIPAMCLTNTNGTPSYRLPAPYFVDALVSTERLDNQYIGQRLRLKNGFVVYYVNKHDAEEYASEIRTEKINHKKAEIEQLKADIENFLKVKPKF